jgi:hypothetical protein
MKDSPKRVDATKKALETARGKLKAIFYQSGLKIRLITLTTETGTNLG